MKKPREANLTEVFEGLMYPAKNTGANNDISHCHTLITLHLRKMR